MGEIIQRPIPPIPMPFTGERLTSEYNGQTEIEHLHRYLLAREWCREKDVLDVASGEGYGSALLAQVAKSVVGIEISPDAVAHATSSYMGENLNFMSGDARSLPAPDASYDVVVSFETIEHFAEQMLFLNEVRRVLRPGGLFVVSTPDRDSYSPTDSPVNPYHVKEMTGTEFETLLRSAFANVSFLMQRPIFGSVLLPGSAASAPPMCFERRGAGHFEASIGLARPQYLVAFASDRPITNLSSSVYIETSRLGTQNPDDAAARLDTALAAVAAGREEQIRLRQETDNVTTRVATLMADLETCRTDLATARGEKEGLLAANEMAERACAALRAELLLGRTAEHHGVTAAAPPTTDVALRNRVRQLQSDLKQSQADLTNIKMSHSWRITAPLRWISRILYPRP